MRLNKLILTSTVLTASLTPSFSLTSCSQKWGFLNPISFGSVVRGTANDPFINFRNQTTYYDADGQNIVKYLQSNFIIDQDKSTFYSYTSPVTKWYETKDDVQQGEEPKVLIPNNWKRLNDGWKTTSEDMVTSVTLDDPDVSKPAGVKRTYTNNENFNLISNINFSSTIASAILNYVSNALQYQASQISSEDKTERKDLNAAWGSESKLFSQADQFTINTGDENQNRDFYEYIFATTNSHGTGKTNSFLRPVSVNFSYLTFPYPTYNVDTTKIGIEMDIRLDVSKTTKKLLMGKKNGDDDIKFCQAGKDSHAPAYYTDLKKINKSIPYKDENNNWQNYILDVNEYMFDAVPILVQVDNLSSTWVNPTKNNAFIPNDYFIKDKKLVSDSIGNAWDKITEFATGEKTTTIQTFDFNMNQDDNITFKIPDVEYDQRIIDPDAQIDGNTFIILTSYLVDEYNSDDTLTKISTDFAGKTIPPELSEESLKKLNVVSLNNMNTIFPSYLLALDNEKFFKKANNLEGVEFAHIVDAKEISNYNNKLLGLIRRTSKEGTKAHASQLTQESKDLLAFLAYMFATKTPSNGTQLITNFIKTKKWAN